MPTIIRSFFVLLAITAVSACGQSSEPEIPTSVRTDEQPQTAPRSASADTGPDLITVDEGGGDSEPDVDELAQARAKRQALRDQYARKPYGWDGEAIAQKLNLDDEQRRRLDQAHQALTRERASARNQLRAQRDFQRQAEAAGDVESQEKIQSKITGIRLRLEAAGQTWQDVLERTLTPEQQRTLADIEQDN